MTVGISAAWADKHGSWQQLENNPSCSVWNAYPQPNETVTWSGACTNGKAQGRGTAVRRYLHDGEWIEDKYTVEIKDGKGHGHGLLVFGNGDRYEGDVSSPLKKASLTGFHATAKHIAAKAVSPSSETMRTI